MSCDASSFFEFGTLNKLFNYSIIQIFFNIFYSIKYRMKRSYGRKRKLRSRKRNIRSRNRTRRRTSRRKTKRINRTRRKNIRSKNRSRRKISKRRRRSLKMRGGGKPTDDEIHRARTAYDSNTWKPRVEAQQKNFIDRTEDNITNNHAIQPGAPLIRLNDGVLCFYVKFDSGMFGGTHYIQEVALGKEVVRIKGRELSEKVKIDEEKAKEPASAGAHDDGVERRRLVAAHRDHSSSKARGTDAAGRYWKEGSS